jgi:hypothetical protein
VEVAAERLPGWVERFEAAHGGRLATLGSDRGLVLEAADGSRAELRTWFPPFAGATVPDLAAHAGQERTVGILLVRLGGYAAGVATGERLVASKVGSRQVHGRSAAGGQSQQRFARRRENQASAALQKAADTAAAVLLPHLGTLEAIVPGGDRAALRAVLADRRLAGLRELVVPDVLDVPDPRQAVLLGVPSRLRGVRVGIVEAR